MTLQVIQDDYGKKTGVFIPMEDWALIKTNYPDIDKLENDIPEWQKKILDSRIKAISEESNSIRPISELFDELDAEIL
ncbi:MAG: addiction module component CHP02574 family protein [Cytophagales bacterium]